MRACAILLAGLLLFGRSSGAFGAEDPETLIRQGIALRRAGQNVTAEGYFRRAYELAATPRTAAQLGLVEFAVGDYLNAEAHLSEALASRDAWIVGNLKALEDSRCFVRKNLLRVEIVGAPPKAVLRLEGAPPRPLSPDGVAWASPGPSVTVRLEAPGHGAVALQVGGAAGERQRVVVDLPLDESSASSGSVATPPPAATETEKADGGPSPGRKLRVAGIATAVVGVAAGVLGGVYYEQGTNKLHDYQAAVKSNGKIPWNPDDDNWEGTRNAGATLLIVGGVAAAAGVTLFFVGRHRPNDETVGAQVSFLPEAGGGFFSYGGRF